MRPSRDDLEPDCRLDRNDYRRSIGAALLSFPRYRHSRSQGKPLPQEAAAAPLRQGHQARLAPAPGEAGQGKAPDSLHVECRLRRSTGFGHRGKSAFEDRSPPRKRESDASRPWRSLGVVRENSLKDLAAPGGHVEQLTPPHVPHRGLRPLPGHTPERFNRPRDPWLMERDPHLRWTIDDWLFRSEPNAPGGDVSRQPLEQDGPIMTLKLQRQVRTGPP